MSPDVRRPVPITALAIGAADGTCASLAQDGTVRLAVRTSAVGTDAAGTDAAGSVLLAGPFSASGVALHDRRLTVAGARDQHIEVWQASSLDHLSSGRSSLRVAAPVERLAVSSTAALVSCSDRVVRLCDLRSAEVRDIGVLPAPARALAIAPDASIAVVAARDGTLRRFRLDEASEVSVTAPALRTLAVGLRGDVIGVDDDGWLWRCLPDEARCRATVRVGAAISALAVDSSGRYVLTADATEGVLLRTVLTGRTVRDLTHELSPPSPDLHDAVRSDVTGAPWGVGTGVLDVDTDGDGIPGPDETWSWRDAGGPDVDLVEMDDHPDLAPRQPPLPVGRAGPSSGTDDAPAATVVDRDVQFTAYRPVTLSAGQWASLLVFAHKTEPAVDPARGTVVDPVAEVRRRAREHFEQTPLKGTSSDAREGLPRGAALRVAPDLPGFECNPPSLEFAWWEPIHEARFRIRPAPHLAGETAHGTVRVWCGPVIIADVVLAIPVETRGAARAVPHHTAEPLRTYRKIFPSYSRRDRHVVELFSTAARALGDDYLQDVLALRAGEEWNERLLELIDEADVFQLFWSSHSMRSPHCREEWEHALATGRPSFVRPIYWEEPLPEDPHLGLPPPALRQLHFARIPRAAGAPPSPPSEVDELSPTGELRPTARDPGPALPARPPMSAPSPVRDDEDQPVWAGPHRRGLGLRWMVALAVGLALGIVLWVLFS